MKAKLFLFITFFMLLISQIASANWGLKIGINYSYLKNLSYSEPCAGVMYGITKDWQINHLFNFKMELLFANSRTVLRNKSILNTYPLDSYPYLSNEILKIYYYDMHINLNYLEIPLLLKLNKPLKKNMNIGLEMGVSLKFLLRDASNTTVLRIIRSADLTAKERKEFRFDYRVTKENENYSYAGRGLCPTIGIYFNYMKLQMELRYQVDTIKWISSIVIGNNVPFYSASISVNYQMW